MLAEVFWARLKHQGITFYAGVPDSTFQAAYDWIIHAPAIRYVPAVREDVALGVASAAYFAGQLGGVLMQNSGLGNIVNPLTSFSLVYRVPVLLIIGWRGHGGPPSDAPEHWIIGAKTHQLLELLEIPYKILEEDNLEISLQELLANMRSQSIPGALLVRPGTIQGPSP